MDKAIMDNLSCGHSWIPIRSTLPAGRNGKGIAAFTYSLHRQEDYKKQ